MGRPGKLCKLQAGKAIGASVHQSFAETFNWLVDCMKNIKGGSGINVKWVNDTTPEISSTETEDEGNTGGGGGGGIEEAVWNVTGTKHSAANEPGVKLHVSYADDREAKDIDIPTGITIGGSDGSSTYKRDNFYIGSGSDSNIAVHCYGNQINIDVYYV